MTAIGKLTTATLATGVVLAMLSACVIVYPSNSGFNCVTYPAPCEGCLTHTNCRAVP